MGRTSESLAARPPILARAKGRCDGMRSPWAACGSCVFSETQARRCRCRWDAHVRDDTEVTGWDHCVGRAVARGGALRSVVRCCCALGACGFACGPARPRATSTPPRARLRCWQLGSREDASFLRALVVCSCTWLRAVPFTHRADKQTHWHRHALSPESGERETGASPSAPPKRARRWSRERHPVSHASPGWTRACGCGLRTGDDRGRQ